MPDRVLITGANGFIGPAAARGFLARGHQVLGLARRGKPAQAGDWAERVIWVADDAFVPETRAALLWGCSAVIHCVGLQ